MHKEMRLALDREEKKSINQMLNSPISMFSATNPAFLKLFWIVSGFMSSQDAMTQYMACETLIGFVIRSPMKSQNFFSMRFRQFCFTALIAP